MNIGIGIGIVYGPNLPPPPPPAPPPTGGSVVAPVLYHSLIMG